MQDKYSNDSNRNSFLWCTAVFDWPYEIVIAEAQVTALQLPNLFEWAVVRILKEFEDNRPTLCQTAEELGIKDPVFLAEAIERLIESGIVERIDADGKNDFDNYRLTNQGNFQQQKRTLPERHGLKLCFDAITGCHIIQQPAEAREKPRSPILPPRQLPQKRTDIGLDTAREYAKNQGESFLAAQSKMTSIKIHADEGSFTWQPCEAALTIDHGGTIRCNIPSATQAQQQWIEELDFKHKFFETLFSASANAGQFNGLVSTVPHDNWRPSVNNLIDPVSINKEMLNLVASAKQQLLINAYWLSLPGIRKALKVVAGNNVRCVIFGRSCQLPEISDEFGDSVKTVELDESIDLLHAVSVIADGSKAISINKVQLQSPSKRQLEIIAASTLKSLDAVRLQEELLGQLAGI